MEVLTTCGGGPRNPTEESDRPYERPASMVKKAFRKRKTSWCGRATTRPNRLLCPRAGHERGIWLSNQARSKAKIQPPKPSFPLSRIEYKARFAAAPRQTTPMLSLRLFLALVGAAFASSGLSSGAPDVPAMLDHILLGSSDLDGGIAFVREHTGVSPAPGGVHPGRGTRNALLSLGGRRYLEIIAPDPAQPGSPDIYGLKKLAKPRLVGWAAHTGDLGTFAARLRGAGIAFDGPTPGERRRPDGGILRWKTINLHDDQAGLLPFFIEWSADTVHPSADAPPGCEVLLFEISAPDDGELRRKCTVLGVDVRVAHGDTPRLLARIASLNARIMTLAS